MRVDDRHPKGRLAPLADQVTDPPGEGQSAGLETALDPPVGRVLMGVKRPLDGDGVGLIWFEDAERDDLELGGIAARPSSHEKRGIRRQLDSRPQGIRLHRPAEAEHDVAVRRHRRRVVGGIDRSQGGPPLGCEAPRVLQRICLPARVGITCVQGDSVGGREIETDVVVDEDQGVVVPGKVAGLGSTAGRQAGREHEPALDRIVVHGAVEGDSHFLVGGHLLGALPGDYGDDPRRVEGAGSQGERSQPEQQHDCPAPQLSHWLSLVRPHYAALSQLEASAVLPPPGASHWPGW